MGGKTDGQDHDCGFVRAAESANVFVNGGGHALALTRAIQHLTNELPHAIRLDLQKAEAPPASPFNRLRYAWREGLRGREAFGPVVHGRAYLVRIAYLAGSYAFGYRVRCCGVIDGGGKDRSSLTRCRKRVA